MADEIKRFKLREEKHLSTEITLMKWSPTMDLIALALASGEVIVNRLSWQRVWSYPQTDDPTPDANSSKVSALCWRPDGKYLAIGYTSGVFRLHDVEKGRVISEGGKPGVEITSLFWLEQSKSMSEAPHTYPPDNSSSYLPLEMPVTASIESHLNRSDSSITEKLQMLAEFTRYLKELNLLVVGTSHNTVHLYAYGFFHVGVVNLTHRDVGSEVQVIDSAMLSSDLNRLSIVARSAKPDGDCTVQVYMYDTALLVTRHEEIRLLSSKFGMIKEAKAQIAVILHQMSEAWEEILRVMDSNLLKFAKAKKERNEGSISNDFLELLLFGTASLELKTFLIQELTAKGLEKLGYSIENSYTNIQKLVVRQLQRASQNLVSHLSDLYGMAQWHDKFGVLGLEPRSLHAAVQSAAEFAVSAHEMQQVIDTSIKNFKAFFRWLYLAIMRLSRLAPPPEIDRMTQHDIKFVADFLKDSFNNLLGVTTLEFLLTNSDEDEEEEMDSSTSEVKPNKKKCHGFRLEKVGQYLDSKEDILSQPPDYSLNPWIHFLESSTVLKDSKVVYPRSMHGKSMSSRVNMLVSRYKDVQIPIAKVVGRSMHNIKTFQLFTHKTEENERPPKVCQFIDDQTELLWMVFVEQELSEVLYIMRHPIYNTSSVDIVKVKVGLIGEPETEDMESDCPACDRHLFLDVAVFNPQTLTLMLKEARSTPSSSTSENPQHTPSEADVTILIQLPLTCLPETSFVTEDMYGVFEQRSRIETVDVGPLLPRASISYQPNIVGHSLAVCGVRTTASVLLPSRRRIRLFLLEDGDEEDDDDDEDGVTKNESSQLDASTLEQTSQDISGMIETDGDENKENSI